jgi:DNA topoisomerase-1
MVRLVKVARSDLTIIRQRRGKGFCYFDSTGALVADPAIKARVQALGIPPAWKDVRISARPNGHIQALGKDEAGREQYVYHADWELRREGKKVKRLSLMTAVLPRLRKQVQQDLLAPAGSRELALAIGVALIDRTAMRVGREKYLEANGTRGAGTLFSRDVRVSGDDVVIAFDAKGGKRAEYGFTDAGLAQAIARIKTIPGKRLLVFRNAEGAIKPIKTSALNAYMREVTGIEISAKDFRTLRASSLAAESLAKLDTGKSASARKRQMAQVAREVSEVLKNTPAICRKSYITPCLFKLFDEGKLQDLWSSAGPGRAGLLQREKRLAAVLASVS